MEDTKANKTANNYVFELSGAPDEIVGKLTSGSVDIAAIPTNLALTVAGKENLVMLPEPSFIALIIHII